MPKAPPSSTDIIEIVDPNLRAGFAQVPRLVLRARGLSNTAKLVYALLLDYAWQKGSCFPGQQQLAEDLDTTKRTIQRALIELRDYKLIAWRQRGFKQTNVYSILNLADNPNLIPSEATNHEATKMSPHEATKMSGQERTKMSSKIDSREYKQRKYKTSKLRVAQPPKQKADEAEQGEAEPMPSRPTVSYEEFSRIQQQLQQPTELTEETNTPPESALMHPEQSVPPQRPGLVREYLSAARTKAETNVRGLSSIASVLPKPEPTKRTYTQERQVLVDVIADLAREFRDEAKLTESVSRAYNLMGKAGIADIGVFTSKIYEARSITKERYGTITRRMPYFFSVLQDVCGLRPKNSTQNPASG